MKREPGGGKPSRLCAFLFVRSVYLKEVIRVRRKELETTEEQAMAILKRSAYGTLSMVMPDGSPYGVPVNFYLSERENAIFFHCAKDGEKIRCIRHCPKVSVSAVAEYTVVPEDLTTLY